MRIISIHSSTPLATAHDTPAEVCCPNGYHSKIRVAEGEDDPARARFIDQLLEKRRNPNEPTQVEVSTSGVPLGHPHLLKGDLL